MIVMLVTIAREAILAIVGVLLVAYVLASIVRAERTR